MSNDAYEIMKRENKRLRDNAEMIAAKLDASIKKFGKVVSRIKNFK